MTLEFFRLKFFPLQPLKKFLMKPNDFNISLLVLKMHLMNYANIVLY